MMALNTIGQVVPTMTKREVMKLKGLIGESSHRASVLAVEGATKVKSGVYGGRVLKKYCMVNELEIGMAWNPGLQKNVNTYPAEAWLRCHGVDLGVLFADQMSEPKGMH